MKKQGFPFLLILQLLILTCTSSLLFSQEWMEPVNVSNMPDHLNLDADMIIDNNGVIHVVWSMRMTNSLWWWNIMYTCSKDDGSTWAEPLDLLQNTDLWMSQPHINCDSKNHLYVTYDYATGTPYKMVYLIVYDGHRWSNPILVSEGMPGSDYNKVVVDNNDRVLVFWNLYSFYTYYRIFDGNLWSEFYCPFCDSTDKYLVSEHTKGISNDNFIKWSGASASVNYYGERAQYYELNIFSNTWEYPELISNDTMNVHIDISRNSNNIPVCVYRKISEINYTASDSTKYVQKEGNYWGSPELVSGTERMQINQKIAIDQNDDKHIVEAEFKSNSTHLMHYHTSKNLWFGSIIDSSTNFCNPTKLLFHQDKLYLVYFKDSIPGTPDDDIFFTKYDIVTGKTEQPGSLAELKIYPNPASGSISIEFENNNEQEIELSVYDITGKHIITLINKNIPPGVQQILWNGKDKNGKEVKSGSYLVSLSYGRNFVSQTVEIVR